MPNNKQESRPDPAGPHGEGIYTAKRRAGPTWPVRTEVSTPPKESEKKEQAEIPAASQPPAYSHTHTHTHVGERQPDYKLIATPRSAPATFTRRWKTTTGSPHQSPSPADSCLRQAPLDTHEVAPTLPAPRQAGLAPMSQSLVHRARAVGLMRTSLADVDVLCRLASLLSVVCCPTQGTSLTPPLSLAPS